MILGKYVISLSFGFYILKIVIIILCYVLMKIKLDNAYEYIVYIRVHNSEVYIIVTY